MSEQIKKLSVDEAKEEAKAQLIKKQVDKKNKLIADFNNNLIKIEKIKIENRLSSDGCATYKNPTKKYIDENNDIDLEIAEIDKRIENYQRL